MTTPAWNESATEFSTWDARHPVPGQSRQPTPELLHQIVDRFTGVQVLVVGDLILDKYTIGKPTRISREAPVAVLEFVRELVVPGGGSSPACTVASLGGSAYLAGVTGADAAAGELRIALTASGVHIDGIQVDPSRPTICKSRIVAQVTPSMLQQVARVDYIDRSPISGTVEKELLGAIEKRLPLCDAVLLSNYKSGTLTGGIIDAVRRLALEHGKVLSVDSQGDLPQFAEFGIVKCNQAEAEAALQTELEGDDSFEKGMARLIQEMRVGAVIITRSAEGMSVMTREGEYAHIPVTNSSEVFDVTGAGDTVIAIITLAAAAGADIFAAATLANIGAGIVVRKWGNAILREEELRAAISAR
jgi:rfaE bifunctional protein kinase chain/domain